MTLALTILESRWPGPLLNANSMRGQTRYFAGRVKAWRALGKTLAADVPAVPVPARVWLEVTQPTNHRRDASNLAPTAKALVDGLVDAGILPDDCDGVIEGPFVRRTYPNGPPSLRLVIEPMPPDTLGRPHPERPRS